MTPLNFHCQFFNLGVKFRNIQSQDRKKIWHGYPLRWCW